MKIEKSSIARDDEFDLKLLFLIIWKYKIFLVIVTSLFAGYSIFYSLSLPNIYSSESTLTQSESAGMNTGGGLSSQYASLGRMVGVNLSSPSSSSSQYSIAVIQSKSFLEHLLNKYDFIAPGLIAIDSYDEVTQSVKYNENIYKAEEKKWVRDTPPYREKKPTHIELHDIYTSTIEVKNNTQTGLITLSASHKSPIFAYELISVIINEINEISREKDLNNAKRSLDYLEERLLVTNESAIRAQINMLILNNINKLMTSQIKKNYVLDILDPPHIAEFRSSPSRAKICIMITISGFILSLLLIVIYYFNFSNHPLNRNNYNNNI